MERKGQRNVRRQRRSRSWLFSPIVITQLALVMVLVGVGSAFALTPHTITTEIATPWAGTASITDSTYFKVANYSVSFNTTLTAVNTIRVGLDMPLGGTHSAALQAVILDGSGNLKGSGTLISASYSSNGSVNIPISPNVSITDVGSMNILVTEQ